MRHNEGANIEQRNRILGGGADEGDHRIAMENNKECQGKKSYAKLLPALDFSEFTISKFFHKE